MDYIGLSLLLSTVSVLLSGGVLVYLIEKESKK